MIAKQRMAASHGHDGEDSGLGYSIERALGFAGLRIEFTTNKNPERRDTFLGGRY